MDEIHGFRVQRIFIQVTKTILLFRIILDCVLPGNVNATFMLNPCIKAESLQFNHICVALFQIPCGGVQRLNIKY